jgi:hypothetical protein
MRPKQATKPKPYKLYDDDHDDNDVVDDDDDDDDDMSAYRTFVKLKVLLTVHHSISV